MKLPGKKTIRNLIVVVLICGASFYGYRTFFSSGKTRGASGTGSIVTVATGDIKQTIKALGSTSVVNEQKIRFNQTGKVTKVNVKEGDNIKKDQIIAELDQTDVNNTIAQNKISYENAVASLATTLKGNDESKILQAQASVSSSQHKLDIANEELANLQTTAANKITTLQNSVKETQISLETAQKDASNVSQSNQNALDQAQKSLESATSQYEIAKKSYEDTTATNGQTVNQSSTSYALKINNGFLEVKNAIIDANTILNDIDSMLGITDQNKYKISAYSLYLSAKDTSAKDAALNYFASTSSKRDALVASFAPIASKNASEVDSTTLQTNLSLAKEVFDEAVLLTDATYNVFANSITSATFTESQLSSLQNSASSKRSSAQSRLSSLITTISNIKSADDPNLAQTQADSTLSQRKQSMNDALSSKEKAQQNLDELKNSVGVKAANASLSIIKNQNSIEDLRQQIDETQASYDTQIQGKKNSVKEAEDNLAVAKQSAIETKRGATTEEITRARNDVETRRLAWVQSKKDIEKYQIIAPFDGTILSIDFKTGDNLLSDDTKYVYIQNPNLVEVSVLLDQTDIIKVKNGMGVSMVFYSYPDNTFTGKISQISGIPTISSSVTSYEAIMVLDTQGKTFYSGMTQTVTITLSEKTNVLTIPLLSITTTNKKKYVQVAGQ